MLFVSAFVVSGCSEDSPTTPKPDPTDTTTISKGMRNVVFAHGAMEAADVFTHLTQLMVRNGYEEAQMHAFDFQEYLTADGVDVETMATQLNARINAVLGANIDQRVDIVAHGAGVMAVQHYLARMNGTNKVAHVVYAGGEYDFSLTVNGDITPAPCVYMTLRSDGNDALQLGNSEYGSLAGAQNEQLAGLDNIQLVSKAEAFSKIFNFFTGQTPSVMKLNITRPGVTYEITGRVINFFDNTPVAGASVLPYKIRRLSGGDIQRQVGTSPVTTDQDGFFSISDVVPPDSYIEFLVRTPTGSHFDMHVYRQGWRENSRTERLRVVPRSGGSSLLTQFSAALRTGSHAIAIVHSQNHALYHNRDDIQLNRFNSAFEPIGDIRVLNSANAPAPGSGVPGMNTFMLCMLDYDQDRQDGTGPISAPILNRFGLNSFDVFLDARETNYQTDVILNGVNLAMFNYRSSGASGSNNSGICIVQFEYVP